MSAPMREVVIPGVPNPKQQLFFDSRKRFIAYGGSRGGGKSWALRRKLVGLCLVYPGIHCILIRRSYPELKSNHLRQFLGEYKGLLTWNEGEKQLRFPNQSVIEFGYCADDGDALRYQGQEYDVIAIDEATQLSEFRFSIFKACLRGTGNCPRRMYLTCNPGGIGHGWVKRLFIDRKYRPGESGEDYDFIAACVYDNEVLLSHDPAYVRMLESLPSRLREAWLYGKWDVFDGQFFPEFDETRHVVPLSAVPASLRVFLAFDYGLDMLAALLVGVDRSGGLWVLKEHCEPNLTLSEAARALVALCGTAPVGFAVASPDLWNRRQDSGKSGFEMMQAVPGMPPMRPADDRRIPGWRLLHEYFHQVPDGGARFPGGGATGSDDIDAKEDAGVGIHICEGCRELIRCLPLLLCDPNRPEDASGEPHEVTHAPEALRYAVMSRVGPPEEKELPFTFSFSRKKNEWRSYFDY